jgi:hypothetical protein
MAVGRQERFELIRPRVAELFGNSPGVIERVARVFELMEIAWHDVYGEPSPPREVVDDVLTCSGGTLEGLVDSAWGAVIDWRDLRLAADARRNLTH